MTNSGKTRLFTLLADYPTTLALKRGEVASDLVELDFSDIKVANTGFKPLVREAKFDLGELAIVTYLQAKAYDKPYVLLPAVVLARGQHHTIAYNRERGVLTPADLVDLDFSDIKVANTGFKPLVREAKFDLSEIAIVTYLQAKTYDKPYVLLPVLVMARNQHHTIAYNRERGVLTPADLVGKRVGVRAFSVTTGVWLRGMLEEQYGVDVDKVHWVTFEDPHVAEYTDPPAVERAPAGRSLVQMLLDHELDAAVVGDKLPDPRLAMLIPDHEKAARAWAETHGNPINHMLVIRREISRQRPDVVREVFRMFKESRDIAARAGDKTAARLQFGLEPNRAALQSIIDIAARGKLIPASYPAEELFDDVTRRLA